MSIFGNGGHAQIAVDTLGFLANNLAGYEPTSILREQLQNADDACHKQGHRGELELRFLADRLVVVNPSVFTDEDWKRIVKPASRGKFADAEQTGEFGIGFWGALHLTDTPVVTSAGREVTLHPADGARSREVPPIDGTRFDFVYRRDQTAIGRKLEVGTIGRRVEDEMAAVFVGELAELLLFTRAIDSISIVVRDGSQRRAHRAVTDLGGGVSRLEIGVDGTPGLDRSYLTVTTEIPNPAETRHGRVTVALPADTTTRLGRVFVTFPTETPTDLNLSINGHFRATNDRRSLQYEGEHGKWNQRVFEAGGDAVGRAIETLLDESVTGVCYEDAMTWFTANVSARSGRSTKLLEALDRQARSQSVAPDAIGGLRRPSQLAYLDRKIESVLAEHVGDTLLPGLPNHVLEVLERWGLRPWGPKEVAAWLGDNLPRARTDRSDAPLYLRAPDDALTLIEYCKEFAKRLDGTAILLGTDDAYHLVGGDLRRLLKDVEHLLDGLRLPLVDPRFRSTAIGRAARAVDASWFRAALVDIADELSGRRVPLRRFGVSREQEHVREALSFLAGHNVDLGGVPLAMDEAGVLRLFDENTVRGVPQGPGRKPVGALARRFGYSPLHPSLDDASIDLSVERFGLSLVVERLPSMADWDAIADSRLLVEAIAEYHHERPVSDAVVNSLRDLPIWASEDGVSRALVDLRLPPPTRFGKPEVPLLAEALVAPIDPAERVYDTLHRVLGVDILDSTEAVVLECEDPPSDLERRIQLMEAFGDCDTFSPTQLKRLRRSRFVLCRDGELREPRAVLLWGEDLPLSLGDRCVHEVGLERRSRKHLVELGAGEKPSADDLQRVAVEIMEEPINDRDPGVLLWNFLTHNHSDYATADIAPLAEAPWLAADPGPARRSPRDCADPNLRFARELFPIPVGVGTPSAELRNKLSIKPTISAVDCVRLGELSVEQQFAIDQRFFDHMERQATPDSDFELTIARLRKVEILTLADGSRIAPDRTVSRSAAALWGHLRDTAPDWMIQGYPNLARAWRMTLDDRVTWHNHLDVVAEIAELRSPDDGDVDLLRARLSSLAEFEFDAHQLDTIRRRGVIPTSQGLRVCGEALRRDLPPDTVRRLSDRLPIAEEWHGVADLWDALELSRLSLTVTLRAEHRGDREDASASRVLHDRASSFLRCLRGSASDVSPGIAASWPPRVLAVDDLTVIATTSDGSVISSWDAAAYLDVQPDDQLTLYVRGSRVDHRAIVDSFSAAFNIAGQHKPSLLGVLQAETTAAAEEYLEWQGVPGLPEEYSYEPRESGLDFQFEESVLPEGPSADNEPLGPSAGHSRGGIDASTATSASAHTPHVDGSASEAWPPPAASGAPESGDGAAPEFDLDGAQSPRGTTDVEALERHGISIVDDLVDEVDEVDFEPTVARETTTSSDEAHVVLSYYDVLHGMFPIDQPTATRLASGPVTNVRLFDEDVRARQLARHLELTDGPMIFASRNVVPGTILRLVPGQQGSLEAILREDPHRVDGVWMLELDENGRLVRFKQDDLELTWETDDAFYRAERRLEDLEALSNDGGKSAVQLIIEVFLARPGEGLTADEIWGPVAVSRLFAKSTIAQTLSQQSGLFEKRDGLWCKTGDELRRSRPATRPSSSSEKRAAATQSQEVIRQARRLVRLFDSADQATQQQVKSILAAMECEDATGELDGTD